MTKEAYTIPFRALLVSLKGTTAADIKYNHKIEISDLEYICCHAFLFSNCLNFTNQMQEEVNHDPLKCVI